jgi:Carboxypeptidase regulatory-like domain/TonB dependent receptor
MRQTFVLALFFVFAAVVFAQTSGGTITGTVSDPAGAVIAAAAIDARNTATGASYPVASSSTGNYTIVDLPAGTYELSVTVPGFKKYVRPGLIVQAAQTIRVNAELEVGAANEAVTVQAETPLLKTETGDVSQTIDTEYINTLPLLDIGTNGAGVRNPYNLLAIVPGTYYTPPVPGAVGSPDRINGGIGGSESILIDGLDATNMLGQGANAQAQPGQDQIEEWTVLAGNYNAEYGQAGQAVYNVTMKSGTNQFHGSVFESYQNAYLNAGQPFTNNGHGQLVNPANTQNDYGFTIGGPVRIPKVYDGRNKTFFFFNWEQYIRNQYILGVSSTGISSGPTTVPTAAYRQGDFSAAITADGNHSLGTTPLGANIMAGEIFDPATAQVVNGQVVTSPFPNNTIPMSRMNPIALKIQSLLPQPYCAAGPPCNPLGVINNYENTEYEHRTTSVPSVKADHIIGPKDKLSFFWNRTATFCLTCYGDDGMAQPISDTFGGGIYAKVIRLNYDRTISPTVLLHLGAGYNSDDLGRPLVTPNYPACSNLGLCSPAFTLPSAFPSFTGLSDSTAGGMANGGGGIGNTGRTDSIYNQFESVASLTWVKENHTFKFGGVLMTQGNYSVDHTDLQGSYGFSNVQTALPYTVTTVAGVSAANIGAYHTGLSYASYLLGLVNTATIDPPSDSRFGKHQLGFYAQDSWKVTRKLTLNLGLRYDYSTWFQEQYGRSPQFDPTLPNAAAGGEPGATIYQATCNCNFAHNYPWGFGPRIGIAYQFVPKTVFRGGFGVVYAGTGQGSTFGGGVFGTASANNPFGPSGVPGAPIMTLSNIAINGNPITASQIAWPNLSSSYYPIGGTIPGTGPQYMDPNDGRPPRQYQYSAGIQREIVRDLSVDLSFVGNYGVWWYTTVLSNYNYLSTSLLNHYGLSLNNPADLAILVSQVGSAGAGPFQNKIPFTGFPLTATVAQSLRPFPQFNAGLGVLGAPIGSTEYDSMQLAVNKRFSHGLQFTYSFVWSKNMDNFGGSPDIQNRSLAWKLDTSDQPFVNRFSYAYTLPKWGRNKFLSQIVRDWQITGFVQFASGLPLAIPAANTVGYPSNLNTATIAGLTFQPGSTVSSSTGTTTTSGNPQNVVAGAPLFLNNLNCHCFNPNTSFVLNPAAWANPAPGQFGSTAPQANFRGFQYPIENMGLGRLFRIKEKVTMNVRAEFTNIFNHAYLNNPNLASPQTAPVCVLPNGTDGACSQPGLQTVSGFGTISTGTTAFPPRVGQLVARITF